MRHTMLVVAAVLAATTPLAAQTPADIARAQDEAVQRTQEYLRINTTNPPGNEAESMRWLARIFAAEGIPFDTVLSAPGRGNIWARLKGGSKPGLMLLHHMDVVPADQRYWSADPFAATTKNGEIVGRGALDTKTLGVAELEAFLALKRSRVPLDRDVVFMATADEEAGGTVGAGWMAKHHPEAFAGVGLLLNEGGDGTIEDGRTAFSIEVTQKTPYWVKITATGTPGHGSTPPRESAANRLVRALYRLQSYEFAPRVVPAVAAYFRALAPSQSAKWKALFLDLPRLIADRDALVELQIEQPEAAALLRNTCSITMLRGSAKINVIPPDAEAQIDCRLLPDQDHAAFQHELAAALNDLSLKLETVLEFSAAVSSTDTPLYRAIVDAVHAHFPDASIAPAVVTGFTDSHWFRDLGIASYGFAPFLIPAAEESGVHGNDERISVENVRRGTQMLIEIVGRVVKE